MFVQGPVELQTSMCIILAQEKCKRQQRPPSYSHNKNAFKIYLG